MLGRLCGVLWVCWLFSLGSAASSFPAFRVPLSFRRKARCSPSCHGLSSRSNDNNNDRETTIAVEANTDNEEPQAVVDTVEAAEEPPPFFAGWPLWLQHGLRDSGGARFVMDTATRLVAAPLFYKAHPWCLSEFVRISGDEYPWLVRALRWAGYLTTKPDVSFAKIQYGKHPSCVAQVMISKDAEQQERLSGRPAPLFAFVHGGAWGSGFPTLYRLVSLPFLERGFRAAVVGYRTFPDATIEGQVDDVVASVAELTRRYGANGTVVLMGHSSGAHACLLAATRGRLPRVDALIGAAGVYDLAAHTAHERTRGVYEISPMTPANGGTVSALRSVSPTCRGVDPAAANTLPPVLLVHGSADTVVPPLQSERLARVLGNRCQLELLDGVGHQEVVLETCLGGPTQSVVVHWIRSTVGV